MRVDNAGFVKAITQQEKRTLFAIEAYGKAAGNKLVAHAKKNALWTDRTHIARNTQQASSAWHGGRYRISLYGGVYYMVFLELKKFKHKGSLAIIFPTVKQLSPQNISAWAQRIRR